MDFKKVYKYKYKQGQCVTKILRILKTTRFNKVLYNLEEEAQRRRSIDKAPLQI